MFKGSYWFDSPHYSEGGRYPLPPRVRAWGQASAVKEVGVIEMEMKERGWCTRGKVVFDDLSRPDWIRDGQLVWAVDRTFLQSGDVDRACCLCVLQNDITNTFSLNYGHHAFIVLRIASCLLVGIIENALLLQQLYACSARTGTRICLALDCLCSSQLYKLLCFCHI